MFSIIRSFFSTSRIFVLEAVLVTNSLTLGILFSTSPMLVLKALLVTNLLTSGFFFLASSILRTYLSTASLNFFKKSIGTVFSLSTSKLPALRLRMYQYIIYQYLILS